MTEDATDRLEQKYEEWLAAKGAEVPNLLEVRDSFEEFAKLMAIAVRQELWGIRVQPKDPVPLSVVRNDQPSPTEVRGPSSPVKCEEIQELEALAKSLFGDSVVCSTVWW